VRRAAIVLLVVVAAAGCGRGDADGRRVASVAVGADAAITTSTTAERPSTTNAPTTTTVASVPTTTTEDPAPAARASPAPPVPPTTTTTTPPAAPQQLSARIELPTRTVVAGGSLDGTLVVTNAGAAPARWLDRDCGAKWAVYLRPGQPPAVTAECAAALVFPPGETRLPFSVRASLSACTQADPHAGLPRCNPPPDVMPHLAPGTYRAALYASAPGLEASEVPVEVVPV
jgi:hypothetical protein